MKIMSDDCLMDRDDHRREDRECYQVPARVLKAVEALVAEDLGL